MCLSPPSLVLQLTFSVEFQRYAPEFIIYYYVKTKKYNILIFQKQFDTFYNIFYIFN